MKAIILGYLDPFRPFCWRDGDVHRGRFIAALRHHAPGGSVLEFRPGALEDLPLWLAAGQIDAIAAKAVTGARAGLFTFSPPLMRTAAALFGPAGCVPPDMRDVATARIATPGAGPLAAMIPALAPRASVVPVRDYEAAFAAVLEGRADWAALNADAGSELADRKFAGRISAPGPRFGAFDLAVAVSPGDPAGVLARLGF